jgi:hypothetical protein
MKITLNEPPNAPPGYTTRMHHLDGITS